MVSNKEYHDFLKFLYFEEYADSYAEAEQLLESLADDEIEHLYETWSNEPWNARRFYREIARKEAQLKKTPGRYGHLRPEDQAAAEEIRKRLYTDKAEARRSSVTRSARRSQSPEPEQKPRKRTTKRSDLENIIREGKIFSEFITEANRRAQRARKSGRISKPGPKSVNKNEKPMAIVTVGVPGSGKSTIAKHMVSQGNTDQHELDTSRIQLGRGPAYFGPDIVKHTYDGARRSAGQGRNTVLSNTSIPRQHRQDAINKLRDSGYENVIPVLAPGSERAAMRRNRNRTGTNPGEGQVPQSVMNQMATSMRTMSRDEKRKLRNNFKELHKKMRFTKPAMRRSGAIR